MQSIARIDLIHPDSPLSQSAFVVARRNRNDQYSVALGRTVVLLASCLNAAAADSGHSSAPRTDFELFSL